MIRDFIPVIDGNNVACLYETVEGKLYYNKGTGTFTAGNTTGQPVSLGDKARKITKAYVGVPASYTPVEYIESSGTQWIDTGVQPNQDTGFEIDFIPKNPIATSGYGYYFGAADDSVTNNRISLNTYPAQTGGEFFVFGTGYNPYLTQNVRKQITYKNGEFSDSEGHNYTVSKTFSIVNSFLLFASRSSTGEVHNAKGTMRLYSFKMYDGGTLVRDFIPVIDQDNVACMYDTVEGKLYYNQGTGNFAAGSTTGQPVSLGSKARLFFIGQNQTPPNTFMLCHFDGNSYDEITKATIPTGFGVNYITGKFSQAAHRTNTNQSQFTNSRLPKLEDVFAGTAAPFTITYWSNGSGDFWYRNTSQVYISSREMSYLGISVSAITNPSVLVKLCYYYTGSNSYARTTTIFSGVTSADYGGTFHHHAIEVMQTGIRFYFDGVLKCTVSHVDYKYNSNNIRYVDFLDIDELMICDGNIYGGTSFLPPQEPYVT